MEKGTNGSAKSIFKFLILIYVIVCASAKDPNETEWKFLSDSECISEITRRVHHKLDVDNVKLEELCNLMGNLEFGAKMAAATFNRKKISASEYIEKLKIVSDSPSGNRGDQEAVNVALLTLDVIENKEGDSGKLAYEIFVVFAYTDYYVIGGHADFLTNVAKSTHDRIVVAKSLLRVYLLADDKSEGELKKLLMTIRKKLEEEPDVEIIRKIFNTFGFDAYKTAIYQKYATEGLKREFPHVRPFYAEMKNLNKFIRKGRYPQAVELAKEINFKSNTPVTTYNLGIALSKSGARTDAIEQLQRVYSQVKILDGAAEANSLLRLNETEIIELEEKLTLDIVGGQLFLNYLKEKNQTGAGVTLNENKDLSVAYSEDSLTYILDSINSLKIPNYHLSLSPFHPNQFDEENMINVIRLTTGPDVKVKSAKLFGCCFKEDLELPRDLKEFSLQDVTLTNAEGELYKEFDVNSFIPPKVKYLRIHKFDLFPDGPPITHFRVSLDSLPYLTNLVLSTATIILNNTEDQLFTPKYMEFDYNVSFVQGNDQDYLGQVPLNKYFNFSELETLSVNNIVGNMNLDLSDSPTEINAKSLFLQFINVTGWENSKWNTEKLHLNGVPFVTKSPMKIKRLMFSSSTIDLSTLPETLEKLELSGEDVNVVQDSEPVDLPNLKSLSSYEDEEYITKFTNCSNLETLELTGGTFNSNNIPPSVNKIIFSDTKVNIGNKMAKLDTIIFKDYRMSNVTQLLANENLKTQHLAIHRSPYDAIEESGMSNVMDFIKMPLQSLTIGAFSWKNDAEFKKSKFSKFVDKKAEYYVFEGKAISRDEFFNSMYN